MVRLSATDRSQLLKLLNALPILQSYNGRKAILETAGLDVVMPQIDLEGAPFVVVSSIINALEAYGRVSYEHEALGLFLNTVKDLFGGADESQRLIDSWLLNYNLMTPVKTLEVPISWKITTDDVAEKIIGENTLRHIAFLQQGLKVSRAVALIDTGQWLGTGFMASRSLLFTNNHVLPTRPITNGTMFRFNYQLTADGGEEKTRDYKVKPNGIFYTNEDFDFTIVELEGSPGDDWAIAPLSKTSIQKGGRVNIVQHPGGQPKQISFQNNIVQYADSKIVQYLASTLGGSSGSPVFNDSWQVVAIHHAGGMLPEPSTYTNYFRNEGINIKAALSNLSDDIRSQIGEL